MVNRRRKSTIDRLGGSSGVLVVTMALASMPAGPSAGQSPPESAQDVPTRDRTDPGPGDTVTGRERPEYDPVGIRAGGFFLYPALSVTEVLHNNIFYEENDPDGDAITVVSPQARLQSNWNRHALTVYADADIGRYASHDDENYADARTGVDGRVDITRDAALSAGVSAARLHEDRSSPDQTGAAEPVTYRRFRGDATITKRFNKLSTSLGGGATYYRYDNVDATGGGVFRSDDRDRRVADLKAQVGYALSPRLEPFVRGRVNDRAYDDAQDSAGVSRDSHGWETVVGTTVDLGGITFGEVYAGYFEQTYEQAALGTISGPSFGGSITWNPTGLTTVSVGVDRSIEETTLNGASGALQTAFRAGVDHELRRNVILTADMRVAERDYEGIGRTDDEAGASAGATYLANEYLELGMRYHYDRRESSQAGASYDAQMLLFRVTGQL